MSSNRNTACVGLFIMVALCLRAQSVYETVHASGPGKMSDDLLFPVSMNCSMYLDSGMAIEIVSMECDGVPVEPIIVNGHFDYSKSVVRCAGMYIYRISPDRLYLAYRDKGAVMINKAYYYKIPESVRTMSIKYRVKTPSGADSEVLTTRTCDVLSTDEVYSASGERGP